MQYDFVCPACGREQWRVQVSLDEIETLPCEVCAHFPMRMKFVPTRNKALVYANDKNNAGGEQFTGPAQRAKWLAERGLFEVGNEDYSKVESLAARNAAAIEEKDEAELYDTVMNELREYPDSQILIDDDPRDDMPITGTEAPPAPDWERLKINPEVAGITPQGVEDLP